jgi:hypothetical protein
VLDGEPLGDHRLAIGVGSDQHQPLGSQGRGSFQELGQTPMAILSNMMLDPPGRADIGDPLLLITVEIRPDMLEQMIRHGYQSSIGSRLFWRGGCSAGGGAGGCMMV